MLEEAAFERDDDGGEEALARRGGREARVFRGVAHVAGDEVGAPAGEALGVDEVVVAAREQAFGGGEETEDGGEGVGAQGGDSLEGDVGFGCDGETIGVDAEVAVRGEAAREFDGVTAVAEIRVEVVDDKGDVHASGRRGIGGGKGIWGRRIGKRK